MTKTKYSGPCLVAIVALSGCTTTGLYDVPDCGDSNEAPLFAETLLPSSDDHLIRFVPPEGGDVCVTIKRLGALDNSHEAGQTVRLRVGPDPLVRALAGGTEVELEYGERDWRRDSTFFAVQLSSNREQVLRINTQDVAVYIEGIQRLFPGDPDFEFPEVPPFGNPPFDFGPPLNGGGTSATQSIKVPEISCSGRLFGFDHPLRFGPNGEAMPDRPEIHRRARVMCEAVWKIEYPNRRPVWRRQSGRGTFTDADGAFTASIPESRITVPQGFNLDVTLQRVEPHCVPIELCGYESGPDYSAAGPGLYVEAVVAGDGHFEADIVDVLELVANGPQAADFQLMLGARLITNATSHPGRNDKPFIIHEQIDVHNEEHTRFFVWGLSGQPVRLKWLEWQNGFKERTGDPRTEPCSFEDAQVCLPYGNDCNPSMCDSDDVACLEYKMLQTLLEAGYDVWIVDNLRGEADITHAAATAPLLYQKILNFGGPLPGPAAEPLPNPDLPVVNTHPQDLADYDLKVAQFLDELEQDDAPLTSNLAAEFLNANAMPSGPIATEPQSGARRAIVAGYSLGGVLARIGLRMWETREHFPHTVIRDQRDRPIEIATAQDVFIEEPGDKIALYVSIDAPHLGARVPVAVQAHLHRLKHTIDSIGDFTGTATAQVNKAVKELTATPARQIMQQEINPLYRNNSLGCFNPDEPDISTCTVTSLEPDVQSRLSEVESTLFKARWIDVISGLEPRTRHGLPATVPSLGFSNGALADLRPVASREVASIRWHLTRGAPDKRHRLCDERDGNIWGSDCIGFNNESRPLPGFQPEGGQWNNICRRITSQPISLAVGSCSKGIGSCYADKVGVELQKVTIDYRMRSRFKNGELVEGTGFPTLVPTKSALLQDDNGNVSSAWRDAQWQLSSQYHTNFDNNMCRVLLFHADGAFDDDADGWHACDNALLIADCRDGGRRPGRLLNPDDATVSEAWCDTEPDDESIHPGSAP